jgi:integrase
VSDKTWVGNGIYTKIPKRGPLAGREVYYGQVWLKAEGRFRHFRLGASPRQAKRKMAAIYGDPEKALAERARKVQRPLLFETLVSSFLSEYRTRGNSDYYVHRSKAWLSYFKGWRIQDIDFKAVEGFREFRRKARYRQGHKGKSKRNIGANTLRKDLVSLGTLFRWAMRRRLASANPVQDVARPSKPDREVVVLSQDEVTGLLAAADRLTRRVIELLLESGLRRGEGLDLKWSQVDRAGGAILIHRSKTGKARSIPLNARLTGVLDRATRHVRSDFVLCDHEGHRLDPYVTTRAVESAMERAGITKTRGAVFNLFRHTFGSRLAETGVDMATIATIMGNSPEVCHRHYIRFSPRHLKEAMARLDRSSPGGSVTVPPTVPDRLHKSKHGSSKLPVSHLE